MLAVPRDVHARVTRPAAPHPCHTPLASAESAGKAALTAPRCVGHAAFSTRPKHAGRGRCADANCSYCLTRAL